jgi:hypothetical protein
MNHIAQFPPYAFVDKLMDLRVPGYEGYPGGVVSISSYLSANASFEGNSKATTLNLALQSVVKNKPEFGQTRTAEFGRVFTGQGSRDNFILAMTIINKYKSEFQANSGLAKYFKVADFLQAMVDDHCLGLDCIGFVGTYLVDAGLEASYVGRRPLDYTSAFVPVQSLDQIDNFGVVMLTNGMHIQIIDEVTQRGNGYVKVDLCQSTSGGPQCNIGVTIRSGGGEYLPVEEFRSALSSKKYAAEHEADNTARQNQGLNKRDYETFLRAKLTQHNATRGFCGGAIFRLEVSGEPKNPVGGSVYVGMPKGGLSVFTP